MNVGERWDGEGRWMGWDEPGWDGRGRVRKVWTFNKIATVTSRHNG